jgi:Zn-dependent peptidase ImmA (M78 family)
VVNIPDYSPPSDPILIKDDEIEKAASALRAHWGLGDGVIRDLIRLVEKNGCVVIPEVVRCDAIDAFSQWSSSGRPMIVANAPTIKGVRWRMDIAHELGHLVMHRNIDKRFIEINPSTHALIEGQAFRFGSAFLMPESSFRESIPYVSLDTLLLAKEYWFLAVAAMLHRAEDLQMISAESARRMWRNRNRRGWRTEEPLDHALPLDEPRVLASAIRTLLDNNPNLVEELSEQVGLEKEEIGRFAGVPVSMLEPETMLDIHTPIRNRDGLRIQA